VTVAAVEAFDAGGGRLIQLRVSPDCGDDGRRWSGLVESLPRAHRPAS
jgi:putative heme degradation protein